MKQVQIKLTDGERTDTIYQPVYAATTAIVDTLIKTYLEWKNVPRRKIQDRTCNPLQATSLHASMAISEVIKKVLENLFEKWICKVRIAHQPLKAPAGIKRVDNECDRDPTGT